MKKIGLICLASLLANCTAQYTSNGEQKYIHSQNGPNIVVPPPLTTENISHFYDLPPASRDPKISIVPPGHS